MAPCNVAIRKEVINMAEEFVDKTFKCADCGKEFTFTAGEQAFYVEKGLHEPKHCPDCRKARKEARKARREAEKKAAE